MQTDTQAELCRVRWRRGCTVIRSVAEPAPARAAEPDAFLLDRPHDGEQAARGRGRARRAAPGRPLPHGGRRRPQRRGAASARARAAATFRTSSCSAAHSRDALAPLLDRAVAVVSTSTSRGHAQRAAGGLGARRARARADPRPGRAHRAVASWAGPPTGSPERLAELAAAAWERRGDQGEVAARCRAYVATEHAPGVIAARWEVVLGLSAPAA